MGRESRIQLAAWLVVENRLDCSKLREQDIGASPSAFLLGDEVVGSLLNPPGWVAPGVAALLVPIRQMHELDWKIMHLVLDLDSLDLNLLGFFAPVPVAYRVCYTVQSHGMTFLLQVV